MSRRWHPNRRNGKTYGKSRTNGAFVGGTKKEIRLKTYSWNGEVWVDAKGNPHPEQLPAPNL